MEMHVEHPTFNAQVGSNPASSIQHLALSRDCLPIDCFKQPIARGVNQLKATSDAPSCAEKDKLRHRALMLISPS